ncbi:glycerol-3-phosphate cytidylyltransferase [Rubrivivax gelatinosus]|uniref:adenylyltransferase/cytidyltransferase family protein n=1 Tax=Rubrivivax gelatinosus TaxID=28068 RepID=UPI001908A3BB|nr:adenylyltransferase/cytidyltransferase family protein [Rubrivivax gelatinosus]MBK1612410.1 glycerol-3-phosphate cytidylyltransferase [Rubrivivax gelatinosus]
MSTVITYGTFDLFHIGHLKLLQRLRSLGDRLVVGVSTDEFNALKGKKTVVPYEHRVEIVRSVRFVDVAFPEQSWDQKRADIVREQAHIFAMGDDWVGKFDDLADVCEVVYLPRTQDVSTTEIRQLVAALHADKLAELQAASRHLQQVIDKL